ncbi:putative receptor-like protein kinase At3g47110 [Cornus florida]|uniref:putative receptor-like protein kinase At3g47110 n=1 Tax=Cornus florida TaxID=4283 RepID=UPI00289664C0|nr:putative receptor-like protein kinase At3g47110 [Cornus florida]XP_059653892.1 putative receptor-like protein kinase At3g47110 [Cornus florida]
MEHSGLCFGWFVLIFNCGILLLCMISGLESAVASTSGNQTDQFALLDFKNRISHDPLQIMSSWNDSIHYCDWVGVSCSSASGRVLILNLESLSLIGSIPPSIGNLTYLTGINLQDNSFHGDLPQSLGHLLRLQHLNLSSNSFSGKIPTNLSHCTELRFLKVNYNELIGSIPAQLSSLSKLLYLGLASNNRTGTIPAWIGNFSSLLVLGLTRNNLYGRIPPELGGLSRLGVFQLYGNQLSGTIPLSIYNISSIYYFSVTQNYLHGQLPTDVGFTLPNLQIFAGGVNNFTGLIPVSLPNASRLELIDFAQNSLTGTVPTNLGSLQNLYRINFDNNKLGNREVGDLIFFTFLTNCTSLEVLGLSGNLFGGELPRSIANLSTSLEILTLGSNLIYGTVPVGIENLINLTLLGLEGNYLTGSITGAMGKLQKLEGLYLNVNKFSGPIPSSLGNLTSLTKLFMEENRLEGSIPPSLGNCKNLLVLNLTSNNLSGTIPKEVISLSSLSISLAMGHNYLTGSLPFEVGNLIHLMELDVSDNRLSGEIPSTLSSCLSLEHLLIEGNSFQGTLPESLKALRGLEEIDFSRNNLSGEIPEFLGKFSSLKKLNLSFNNFEGAVLMEGIFANATAISILGNDKLCGGVLDLHLPACSQEKSHSRKFLAPKVFIPVTIAIIFVMVLSCSFAACYVRRNSRKRPSSEFSSRDWKMGVSYQELVRSTNGFSMDNLIGSGSFGSVYKGTLSDDGTIVAVKVLNLQQEGASKSFMDECRALRSIRHRNLLKIITTCSSVDQRGNDFKGLVFEFMSNGSLDQWLHPIDDRQHRTTSMNIILRLNIAIDVASALDYLHHHCETPIVHCDLKPSNVLLDDDMTAHVGDFGLARFLFQSSNNPTKNQTTSAGLKGSIGYIPPEYGMGDQVSTLGDVYSYGILLLEMFTGRRPTDDMFKDGLNLHEFVAMALPERVLDTVDPSLFFEEENNLDENKKDEIEEVALNKNEPQDSARWGMEECLVSVMRTGVSCSNSLPGDRMTMNVVVNTMNAIRNSFLSFKKQN